MVAIGGGTGLSVLLRGLKPYVGSELTELIAVVAVSDDGGSSGRLRRDFEVLPPGDVRNCIVALADDEDLLSRLFQYRFPGRGGLAGHSFGNLFLTALTGITGDFYRAILTAEEVLSVRGRILPAALSPITLRGHGGSGTVYEGESQVGRRREILERLELVPPEPIAFPPAIEAIESADLVVLGPGSLYTSILADLLIPGIGRAVRSTPAPVLLVANLMTQPGETDGMAALDHLEAIDRHLGRGLVDAVLVNSAPPAARRLRAYARGGSEPVAVDRERLAARGVEVTTADLLDDGDLVRHEPRKLARALLAFVAAKPRGDRETVR